VALCRSVLDANRLAANRKHLNLVVELPDNLTVQADPELLTEAFDNYVNNAVKYSPQERTIRITLQQRSDIGMAEFAVQDEGPGLTANDMQHVFGKFRRLSARPTGGEHSTGLGLSIVKQVVELHGGTVGCDSTAGNGARFWARLPLQSAT
jgi:signal transduction histidine kinase